MKKFTYDCDKWVTEGSCGKESGPRHLKAHRQKVKPTGDIIARACDGWLRGEGGCTAENLHCSGRHLELEFGMEKGDGSV